MSEPEGMTVDEVKVTEARDLLARGKKYFWLREFEEALSCLGRVCSIYADAYGETAYECAEPFLLYGKALLEVARLEGDVFGEGLAMDKDDEDEDDGDGKEKNRTHVYVTCLPDLDEVTGEPQPVSMEGDRKDCSEESMNLETAEEELLDEETGDFENITSLHLSWEMIECARCIFLKNAHSRETHLKVAETYLQLGLIGLESETYDQAVDDLLSCLKIQEKHSASSRLIAETHFSLGVAHCLNRNIEASKKAYSSCIDILQNTSEELGKNKGESAGELVEEKELESIVQEVSVRIKELDDAKAESRFIARKMMVEAFCRVSENRNEDSDDSIDVSILVQKKGKINKDGASTSMPSEEQTSEKDDRSNDGNSKLASDITHLIRRRKRKADKVNSKEEADDTIPSKVLKNE